ncbi:MAG TPA: glycosyltransferase family 2 protein [Epulopiscium sp.]|nr:glycosyltransferase family 2 protein [Candidatus Epulonipiscium sp.]
MDWLDKMKTKRKWRAEVKDILLAPLDDRRILPNIPDKEEVRTNLDRRGKKILEGSPEEMELIIEEIKSGIRYEANLQVDVTCYLDNRKKMKFSCKGIDISTTGILLEVKNEKNLDMMNGAKKIKLKFEITPGSMPEGYEMKVNMLAKLVRVKEVLGDNTICGFEFEETLSQYSAKRKDRYMLSISSLLLFSITCFIILMRAGSVIYFRFNKFLYLYSIIAATFLLSRYFFGMLYRPMKINGKFTPGVTIIIPCFNEEEWIGRTIKSCMNQDYPIDKLEVIIVDDCSNDGSVEKIKETLDKIYKETERYNTKERLQYVVQEQNAGKRDALARATKMAKHELVVFVDSDSFLDPFAIRNLVQPFQDPKMGGVSGRTDVANTYTNVLTKMQSVRYYIAFRIMKAAEAYFDAVTCLSGPLACYRKEIVLENMDEWLNQKFLGQRATFGDDRSLTNFVLKNHRTGYQDTATCATIVPNTYNVFLKQQMRWKRSWLRESIIAGGFIWKKEPFTSLFFYMGLMVPIFAPIIVLYNLIYVPIVHRIFPTTFLVGILMMSLLMSFTQMIFRKSTTWIFGMVFVLYYEAVLLWQMPIAWVTFWKSTWGTRMTPEDLKEAEKKKNKRHFWQKQHDAKVEGEGITYEEE